MDSIHDDEKSLVVIFSKLIFATTKLAHESVDPAEIFKENAFYMALQGAIRSLQRFDIGQLVEVFKTNGDDLYSELLESFLDILDINYYYKTQPVSPSS